MRTISSTEIEMRQGNNIKEYDMILMPTPVRDQLDARAVEHFRLRQSDFVRASHRGMAPVLLSAGSLAYPDQGAI